MTADVIGFLFMVVGVVIAATGSSFPLAALVFFGGVFFLLFGRSVWVRSVLNKLKKTFWMKVYYPPLIPEGTDLTANFKVPLELMNAVTRQPVKMRASIYPLVRVANPMVKGKRGWLVIEATRIGAIESQWEDWIRAGVVEIE